MPRHRSHPSTSPWTSSSRPDRTRRYAVEVLKLDNPGAGTRYFVASDRCSLVQSKEAAAGMSQADAKSLVLSNQLHRLLLSINGMVEPQVLKLW